MRAADGGERQIGHSTASTLFGASAVAVVGSPDDVGTMTCSTSCQAKWMSGSQNCQVSQSVQLARTWTV